MGSTEMGRKPYCVKEGLNRGTWSALEDKILCNYIEIYGEGKWKEVPPRAGKINIIVKKKCSFFHK